MHAGWRYYLKQRFKKSSAFCSVGLEFKSETVQLCALKEQAGQLQWVKQQLFPLQGWVKQVSRYVSHHDLQNTPANLILGPAHYQLVQVEKPALAENELQQALVWSVKDLVSYPGDLAVDYFDLPAQSAGANNVNVAVMPKQALQQLIDGVDQADLDLHGVGIAELAVADLVGNRDDAVLTLIQEAGQEVCLNIIKHGNVYFSRRLRGYENLSTFNQQELQMGVGDNLSIEIQRSMDYFESQLRQAPVQKILLGLDTPILPAFAQILQQLTFMPVEPLAPHISHSEDLSYSNSYLCSLSAAVSLIEGRANEK